MNKELKKCYEDIEIVIKKGTAYEHLGYNDSGELRVRNYPAFNTSLDNFVSKISSINVTRPYESGKSSSTMMVELENNEIPYFVYPVYHFFLTHHCFPTLEQATDEYLRVNCDKIKKGEYRFKKCFQVKGDPVFNSSHIKGRMFRAYFSYVREIHLLYSLMQYDDIEVYYQFSVDTKEGLDIVCKCNGKTAYIASYVGTYRSFQWKNCKNTSKHAKDYNGKLIVDAPAYIYGSNVNCVQIGDAYVYSEDEIRKIHDEIVTLCA